jgi:nucleotide-binding universal stress UspA family protein
VDASTTVVHGEVIEAILTLAKERGVDLIVIGSHGRSGIGRALIGSKAEGMIRRSRVPVLIAPHPWASRAALRPLQGGDDLGP